MCVCFVNLVALEGASEVVRLCVFVRVEGGDFAVVVVCVLGGGCGGSWLGFGEESALEVRELAAC